MRRIKSCRKRSASVLPFYGVLRKAVRDPRPVPSKTLLRAIPCHRTAALIAKWEQTNSKCKSQHYSGENPIILMVGELLDFRQNNVGIYTGNTTRCVFALLLEERCYGNMRPK